MLILVTNDDGVYAKGIQALVRALQSEKKYRVVVAAPDGEQSGKSHSLTLHRPLRITKIKKDVYSISGTPTDAVMLGCAEVLKRKPDLLVSGINSGVNVGDDVHYSGTVSAAIEGGLMGIPAIAISQLGRNKFDFTMAMKFAQKIVAKIFKEGLPNGVVLNVNVPEKIKNLKYEITKTGKRNYGEASIECLNPRGRKYYWIGGDLFEFQDIKGSDCNAIVAGKISVTPLKVNITDHHFLKKIKAWKI